MVKGLVYLDKLSRMILSSGILSECSIRRRFNSGVLRSRRNYFSNKKLMVSWASDKATVSRVILTLANIMALLRKNGAIDKYLFTICMAQDGGYFSLGGVNSTLHTGDVRYIPLLTDMYHRIELMGMEVDNSTIDISKSYYTIIDSGTTISYFPEPLVKSVMEKIDHYCAQPDKCLGDPHMTEIGQCYKVKSNVTASQFKESMPEIKFVFRNNIEYYWKPEAYLFNNTRLTDKYQTYCTGFTGWK
jgi:hypothetical protein